MENTQKQKPQQKQKNKILDLAFSPDQIINYIIYAMVIVMPFIITDSGERKYVDGKVKFLYLGLIIAFSIIALTSKIELKREHIIGLIFLATIGVATIFSKNIETAIWGNIERREGLIMYFVYIALFIFSTNFFKVTSKGIDIILAAGSLMSFYSVIQLFGEDPIQVHFYGQIVTTTTCIGTVGNNNFLSTYLLLFLFLSIGLYIFKNETKYLSFATIIFFGLLASRTRGGWITLGVLFIAGAIIFLVIKRKDYLKRLGFVVLAFFIALIVLNISSGNKIIERAKLSSMFSSSSSSSESGDGSASSEDGASSDESKVQLAGSFASRANIARIAWKAFLAQPFIGDGPDTLGLRINADFPDEMQDHIAKYNESIDKAHNEYLEYASCDGLFTIVSYLALIGLIIKGLVMGIKDDKNKILLIVLVGYLVQSFFNISVIMVAPLFWVFLGYCVKKIHEDKKKTESKKITTQQTA